VLIPAHNEEACIEDTLRSLQAQSKRPGLVVVIADNCSDRTVDLARAAGVEVVVTVGNEDKKAGALNQVLDRLLPVLDPDDGILVMDADSELTDRWIEHADRYLETHSACGGVFTGRSGGGLVGLFQRNEYARYMRDVNRLDGRTLVLTGTATLFKASVLRDVITARQLGRLPGQDHVYDTAVLTEDNELTFALLRLGHKIIAPGECHLTTEVMESWGDLHRQRLRWKRGAIENLFQYGFTRQTAKYWGRQLLALIGLVVTSLYLGTMVLSLALTGTVHLRPAWMAVSGIFAVEQVVTVRARGMLMMLLASVLIVEMPYDLFLQATHGRALWNTLRHKERRW
jgi:cellulose synthase/poly-beta-1,6-N-acetylglucosamine synthase-like glycosyltransferase